MKKVNFLELTAAFVLGAAFTTGLVIVDKNLEKSEEEHSHLSEWELTQMGIIMTESNFRTDAVGKTNDHGIFQITPVYVKECNRIVGKNTYSLRDAYNPIKAKEMFDIYQGAKNRDCDYDLAIYLHNPNGGERYYNLVSKNIEFCRRYEHIREIVKK